MGAWSIMGRKGYVGGRGKIGKLKGRGGEKYGELCNNTHYFVIEKRVGGGKPRKRAGSWQVWIPYPQNQ